jgi:hypothetical protein
MSQKKWRFIDDDVILGLVDDIEVEHQLSLTLWVVRPTRNPEARATLTITLTSLLKAALPKRLATHMVNCVCHVERSETSLYFAVLIGSLNDQRFFASLRMTVTR